MKQKETATATITINADKPCSRCGAMGAADRGLCLDCVSKLIISKTPFRVPTEDEFTDSQFIEDIRLEKIGEDFIAQFDDFVDIQAAKILYLWKRKGGKSGGKDTLGKCQKPSGLLLHFARADFVVWLGADNVYKRGFGEEQIKALLFHELKHAGYNLENGEYITIGHDFEGFRREIEVFGFWRDSITEIAVACEKIKQGQLFDE